MQRVRRVGLHLLIMMIRVLITGLAPVSSTQVYLRHILHDIDSISSAESATGRLAPTDDDHGVNS